MFFLLFKSLGSRRYNWLAGLLEKTAIACIVTSNKKINRTSVICQNISLLNIYDNPKLCEQSGFTKRLLLPSPTIAPHLSATVRFLIFWIGERKRGSKQMDQCLSNRAGLFRSNLRNLSILNLYIVQIAFCIAYI